MNGFEPGSIWPAVDPDSQMVREVYSRFGLAMYMAQVLEHGMVNALLVLRFLPRMRDHADRTSWDEAFDKFYDTELSKTFGNMLKALKDVQALPEGLIERLRVAKMHRDHLAHRFFGEHDLDFMTEPGRKKMLAKCEELIVMFQTLDRDLEAEVKPQRVRFGITDAWIEEHVRLMEREARERAVHD